MASADVGTPTADENDDNWLYGDSNPDQAKNNEKAEEPAAPGTLPEEDEEKEPEEADAVNDDEHFEDAANGDVEHENGDSDSDDSDDVKVTIGEIKSVPQTYAIKRAPGLGTGAIEKPRAAATTGNKVNIEDLEGPGTINGVPAVEFHIDNIDDKPWKKPGADISDYFNYGFNEITWNAYCERQRRMRINESGVGIHVNTMTPRAPDIRNRPVQMNHMEDVMHHQPPPQMHSYQQQKTENTNMISVMTADRREYGRRDMQPEYFNHQHDPYYNGPPPHYENTWGPPPVSNWAPSDIKELTPGPGPIGPHMGMNAPINPLMSAPHMVPPPYSVPYRQPSMHGDRERDRERERTRDREERDRRDRDRDRERHEEERERERDRERDRDRDRERDRQRSVKPDRSREKSHRRERSRSRSRRHKSRSRSPRQRERERSTKPKSKDSKDDEK